MDQPGEVQVGIHTMLLAEMQTTILAAGLRNFEGNLERFVIASVLAREVLYARTDIRPISVLSLASSLNRPFETIRRHVLALIRQGYCERYQGGVIPAANWQETPEFAALTSLVHDSFVRFVADLKKHRLLAPMARPSNAYTPVVGIRSAVDIMLAAADTNRTLHGNLMNLIIFSTVVCGNMQRYFRDGGAAGGLAPQHAVRTAAVAQTLNLSEATTRRRVALLSGPDGQLRRTPQGLIVSEQWMRSTRARATSHQTSLHVRRILSRAAAAGFPFDAPERAYIDHRPPVIAIG